MDGCCWRGFGCCLESVMAGLGVGSCGVARGVGMAGCVQRSSGLLATCGAIDPCRGSPQREVSEGVVLGNLELPGYLGN